MEENEIWKDIEYYNGIYKISSLGNVIRFKANRWVRVKSWKNTNGYNQVSLSRFLPLLKYFKVQQYLDMPRERHILSCSVSNSSSS